MSNNITVDHNYGVHATAHVESRSAGVVVPRVKRRGWEVWRRPPPPPPLPAKYTLFSVRTCGTGVSMLAAMFQCFSYLIYLLDWTGRNRFHLALLVNGHGMQNTAVCDEDRGLSRMLFFSEDIIAISECLIAPLLSFISLSAAACATFRGFCRMHIRPSTAGTARNS